MKEIKTGICRLQQCDTLSSSLDRDEIEKDVVRFIRHEAMRAGVLQEDVIEVIKGMKL